MLFSIKKAMDCDLAQLGPAMRLSVFLLVEAEQLPCYAEHSQETSVLQVAT